MEAAAAVEKGINEDDDGNDRVIAPALDADSDSFLLLPTPTPPSSSIHHCFSRNTVNMDDSDEEKDKEEEDDEDEENKNNGDDTDADADADDTVTITAVSTSSTKSVDTPTPTTTLLQYWPEDTVRDDEKSTVSPSRRPAWYLLRVVLRWLIRQYNNWTYSYMNVILRKGATANANNNNKNTNTANKYTTAKSKNKKGVDDKDNDDDDNDDDDETDNTDNSKYHLTSDDLYPVPRSMKSSNLVQQFEAYWKKKKQQQQQKQQLKQQEDLITTSTTPTPTATTNTTINTQSLLLHTLFQLALPTYLPAGLYQFIAVLCVSTMPLVVRQLLFVLESGGVEVIRQGLPWSLLLTFLTFLNGVANHRHRHQAMKTGIALRSATVNILYQHVLRLSPVGAGKRGLTSGEITNLVAVDCQKLYEVTQEGHLIWALPLSIALVTWFLCEVMGPSTLVGIVVLLAFLPLINLVTQQMTKTRSQRVHYSDERIDITVSMLLGMRTTKLNGYEAKYQERVLQVRQQELKLLATEQAWWATTLLMTVSSPVLATGATFATYVLTTSSNDVPHLLTAADTFGVLLLFGALRFPINFAGRLIGRASQALSAVRRIVSFLQRPLRSPTTTTTNTTTNNNVVIVPPQLVVASVQQQQQEKEMEMEREVREDGVSAMRTAASDDVPLIVTNARFRVGIAAPIPLATHHDNDSDVYDINDYDNGITTTTTKKKKPLEHKDHEKNGSSSDNLSFTVGDFNLQLHKGQVLVVCGPVGSGKSTFINGIIDEAETILSPSPSSLKSVPQQQPPPAVVPAVQKYGSYSYAPQDPFIINQSLRENILFGAPYNATRYQQVLEACALRPDIEQMLGGSDLIQIGERGVTLSGGQRQRISLARAAYKDSSVIILDDPFSALDAGTGKLVFERLIASPTQAFLQNRAVLLVTHASHFISHRAVDTILLMVNGTNQFMGTWEDLTQLESKSNSRGIHDAATHRAVEHIQSQVREETNHNEQDTDHENDTATDNEEKEERKKRPPSTCTDTDTGSNNSCSMGATTTNINNKNADQHRQQQHPPPQTGRSSAATNHNNHNHKQIMQQELREHGLSNVKTWYLWFQRAGGLCYLTTVLLLLTIDRFAYVAVEWFLAVWATGADQEVTFFGFTFAPQSDGLSAQAQYLKVYASIVAISLLATALRSEFTVSGGVRATKTVFQAMLHSVLRAPMSYFETVPMGQILNRFTYDTDVNDVTLTQVMSMFIISCSWYVASIIVQIAILPWSALALVPVSGLYLVLMHHYRQTGPDLQRIDALSRSPLQSMVSECLEGATSIRIFEQEQQFRTNFATIVDTNSSAILNFVTIQRWLGVRMETLGSFVVLMTSVLVVCLQAHLHTTAGLAGLLLTWSSNFTITLNFMVDTFSETEAAITAIERCDAMSDLPCEKSMETTNQTKTKYTNNKKKKGTENDDDIDEEEGRHVSSSSIPIRLPKSWPEQGLLEFKNVSLRYREGLPFALNNLSFTIPAGKTCGIVGRTGAGKSSITVALFRLVEIEVGQILLDGIDLTTLGLADVRGRGMSIIPQDPFLAGANLRECLDPFEQRTDDEIMEALHSVRMGSNSNSRSSTSSGSGSNYTTAAVSTDVILSTKLEEGGSNYSVGERQLLNLARALLSQPKVLVLDEATASIDGETDAFIQKMLRTRFPHTTLVTIAHRLNTVMDYDYVLVMDQGRAAQFDVPTNLLSEENTTGIFSQLVDATGMESSKALRQMAMEAAALKKRKNEVS